MTTLIAGGAGYIGSHFVRDMCARGRQVVVLDSLEKGYEAAVLGAPLVVGDIADRALVAQVCAEYRVNQVVHFAAYKAVGESMEDPQRYWSNNVHGSMEFIDTLIGCGVRQLVFSSSCSVYGNPANVPASEDEPHTPESVYAESKAMIERVLHWSSVARGMRSVSLRYFNAAGASADAAIGENWNEAFNLIPLVMKAILGFRPPVQVFGNDYPTPDGTAIRDYIHVDDLSDAHVRSLDYLAADGETTALNIGTGVGSSVFDVIAAAERVSGRTVPMSIGPRRAGDPVSTFADATKAQRVLGWAAVRSLDEIIESAWKWHSTHPYGFDTPSS